MNNVLHYLAYGSNLHPKRLGDRIPSAKSLGRASLSHHQLRFHKNGQDGSAKCDAFHTGNPEHELLCAVYTLTADEKPLLDRIEGLGFGYELAWHSIELNGSTIDAFLYRAQPDHIDESLIAYDWYHAYVLHGAKHHGFPPHYCTSIETINTITDPDAERAAENRARITAYTVSTEESA